MYIQFLCATNYVTNAWNNKKKKTALVILKTASIVINVFA